MVLRKYLGGKLTSVFEKSESYFTVYLRFFGVEVLSTPQLWALQLSYGRNVGQQCVLMGGGGVSGRREVAGS